MSTKDVLYLALFGLIIYLILKMRGQAVSQQAQLIDLSKQPVTHTPTQTIPTTPTTTTPVAFDYKQAYQNYEPNPVEAVTT